MTLVRVPRGFELPERLVTPEGVCLDRRQVLKAAGLVAAALAGCDRGAPATGDPLPGQVPRSATSGLYPAPRDPRFRSEEPLTEEAVAATINNFYEFATGKDVWRWIERFETRPWTVTVGGRVRRPMTFDVDDLVRRMPLEERVYRLRCVEAWSMVVPWTGFPLRALASLVEPESAARYVRFVTFLEPDQAPMQRRSRGYSWPYVEGLTIAEATNALTMLVTGIYGHELPKQHGAPIRLVVPWKYGFKSIKSIVAIEFVRERPATFWSSMLPSEYDFEANVNPAKPHPRWSQATERRIGTDERVPTLPFNGYGKFVATLYRG